PRAPPPVRASIRRRPCPSFAPSRLGLSALHNSVCTSSPTHTRKGHYVLARCSSFPPARDYIPATPSAQLHCHLRRETAGRSAASPRGRRRRRGAGLPR